MKPLKIFVLGLVALVALVGIGQPAYAYDLDVHYLWTYYLALHAGFSERQAYQLGSAAFGIDHDPDTGPLHAKAMDSMFGSEAELLRSDEVTAATRDLAVSGRDLLERLVEPLLEGNREMLASPETRWWDRMAAEKLEPMLAELPNHSFLYGGTFERWRDLRRPVIRNVWSDFHAFAESELLPATVEGTREERVDRHLFELLWSYMPLWTHLFPERFPPELLERLGPGKLVVLTEEAMAARDRKADYLWRLGLGEHNIGPFLHFLQDSFSHQEFDNIRGHATWGHRPDFLADDVTKSRRMTVATLHALCRFRDAVVQPGLVDAEGSPPYARAPVCEFLSGWTEAAPPDVITYYSTRMEVEPLVAGREPDRMRGGVDSPTGEYASHASLGRIFDALDRYLAVNPVPEHLGNWDPGLLPDGWTSAEYMPYLFQLSRLPFTIVGIEETALERRVLHWAIDREPYRLGLSTWARGVVDPGASTGALARLVAEDKEDGLLPSVPGTNLEDSWGYPPSERVLSRGRTTHTIFDQAAGKVWPVWSVPSVFLQFDYDGGGSVLLQDINVSTDDGQPNYVGSSSFLARADGLDRVVDRYEEAYALELPRVEFRSDPEVRFGAPATAAPAAPRDRSSDEERSMEVKIGLEYEINGVKDLRTIHERETGVSGTPSVSAIPLPVVEACTFDGYPYEPLSREERGVFEQEWGSEGSGDDWGTRVNARDVGLEAPGAGCRSCVETELHFRIPRSLLARGSLTGKCSVHLYSHQPWEVEFSVPVARVEIGEIQRDGPR